MESLILDPATTALAWLQAFLLVLIRTTGVFERLPVLGAMTVPRQVKVWLSFTFALVIFPVAMGFQTTPLMPQSIGVFLVAAAGELALGLLIGFIGQLLLTGFQLGGRVMDDQLGFSLANVFDPSSGEQVSVTSQFVFYVGVMLFTVVGGLNMLIGVFAFSFETVPLLAFRMTDGAGWYALTEAFPQSMVLAVTLAAPMIVVVTLATFALGLLGKVVPEMNIFSFSFGVRVFLGLIMLQLSMQYLPHILYNVLRVTQTQVESVIHYVAKG